MTITTEDFDGNVTITWQGGYVPDNSETILREATGNSHTAKLSGHSVYTLKFYKTDSNATYNTSAFTVAEGTKAN